MLVIGLFAAVAVAGIAYIVYSEYTKWNKGGDAAVESITEVPTDDLARLQDALNSSDVIVQSEALAPELRELYLTANTNPFPAGTTVTIDATTFMRGSDYVRQTVQGPEVSNVPETEDNYASVEADVSGQGKWLLHMVRLEDGHWYIVHTEQKG
jgi:hypothetical protein